MHSVGQTEKKQRKPQRRPIAGTSKNENHKSIMQIISEKGHRSNG
jgi:hypothetical protein